MTLSLSSVARVAEQPASQVGARRRRHDTVAAAVFITPGAILFLAFAIAPAFLGLGLSFFDWNLFGPLTFVGFDNLTRVFVDPMMWKTLGVSFSFVALGVVPATLIGFMLACLLNVKMRGIGLLRLLYLTPLVASSAVSAAIWASVFQARGGLINQVLAWFGIVGPDWLGDQNLARPALVVIMVWGSLPLIILIYLAGLQRISPDIYAAASLDGAGRWRQLWSMTWPNVVPTTAIILVLQFVGFLSGSFELALIMTNGGPLGSTTSLALYSYQVAFQNREIGYASALSLFQLLVIIALFGVFTLVKRIWKANR